MDSNLPFISVIVPNWNGIKYITPCLDSLLNQTYKNIEIVVFDNASTDGSKEIVQKDFPKVKLVKNDINVGFARANNFAVEHTSGEYIFLVNNDTILKKDCVEALWDFYSQHQCKVVTCKMVFPDGETLDHAGGMFSRVGIALDRGLLSRNEDKYNLPVKVDYAHGSCTFIKRELYLSVGGFDHDFFQYVEDVDLGLKIRSLGYSIYYCPDAQMIHHDGGTTGRENRRRTKFMVSNIALSMIKNYRAIELLIFLPLFTISRLLLGLAYLLKKRYDLSIGVLEGFLIIPKGLKIAMQKRKYLESLRKRHSVKSEFGFFRILKEALFYYRRS